MPLHNRQTRGDDTIDTPILKADVGTEYLKKAQSQFRDKEFKRQELQAHLGVSQATALRWIKKWAAQGILTRTGFGSKTKYTFGFEIVEVSSPYGTKVTCVKRGLNYIPLGKIEIYGTGKVRNLTQKEKREQTGLNDERTGRSGTQAQREFRQSQKRRLKDLNRKQHNYERSQGNLKALLVAGINPDSLEEAYKIIHHLLTEAENMAIDDMEVGEKVLRHSSRVEGPLGRMRIISNWGMKSGPGGKKRFYLETVIYSAR